MSVQSMQTIMDIIRQDASTEYSDRVPSAVQASIETIANPILDRLDVANEFVASLIGMVAMQMIRQRIATNPLSTLKKGTVPLGSDIQEIITNMAVDQGFDGTGSKLLTRTIPDVKVLYHRRNRQSQYPSTISRQKLATAFQSWEKLEELLSSVINSMYSGDNRDEFLLTKNTFADAIANDKIVSISVPHYEEAGAIKKITKDIIKASKMLKYPSDKWNAYNLNRPTSDIGKPLETWTPLENQILLIRADIMTEIEVEELAVAFNMDKVSFMSRVVEVDNFGSAVGCYAILCDESYVEVKDNLFEMSSFYNGQGLYWNYWLNHWQTYSLSLFANSVAFICGSETVSLNNATLSFTTSSTQTLTATVTPSGADVSWISTDVAVATVSALGVVTPVSDGVCYISAINGDSIANCKVTVNI